MIPIFTMKNLHSTVSPIYSALQKHIKQPRVECVLRQNWVEEKFPLDTEPFKSHPKTKALTIRPD